MNMEMKLRTTPYLLFLLSLRRPDAGEHHGDAAHKNGDRQSYSQYIHPIEIFHRSPEDLLKQNLSKEYTLPKQQCCLVCLAFGGFFAPINSVLFYP